jgi:uncharacterized protein DUF2844
MKLTRSKRSLFGVALLIQSLSLPALAALGGDLSSVESDQLQMKGMLRTTVAAAYTVHEIQVPSGTVVREYVTPAGKVFAVVWRGPQMPDLRQTLGAYFNEYTQAPRPLHPNHAHFEIANPGFVLQSTGHMRAYSGRAYVPQLLPQNVALTDIK